MSQAQIVTELGQAYAAGALGFRNRFMNPDMRIAQRGVAGLTLNPNNWQYPVDRWGVVGPVGGTALAQAVTLLNDASESGLCLYYNQTAGGSAQGAIMQRIEGVRSFAGKKLTLAILGYSFTQTVPVTATIIQSFGTGGSPSPDVVAATGPMGTFAINVPTLLVASFDIPSVAAKTIGTTTDGYLHVSLNMPAAGVYGVILMKAQIEQGPIFTGFEQRSIAHEMAACQRYFWRVNAPVDIFFGAGLISSAGNTATVYWKLAQSMRVAPAVASTGTIHAYDGSNVQTLQSVALNHCTTELAGFDYTLAAVLTGNRPCIMIGRAGAIIDHNAEL